MAGSTLLVRVGQEVEGEASLCFRHWHYRSGESHAVASMLGVSRDNVSCQACVSSYLVSDRMYVYDGGNDRIHALDLTEDGEHFECKCGGYGR